MGSNYFLNVMPKTDEAQATWSRAKLSRDMFKYVPSNYTSQKNDHPYCSSTVLLTHVQTMIHLKIWVSFF